MDFLPHAVITVDRFHVAKAINAELKALKNKEKTHHPEANGNLLPVVVWDYSTGFFRTTTGTIPFKGYTLLKDGIKG